MKSEEFSSFARLRNRVETIPANIRKNYHLDKLPRGKQRGKFFWKQDSSTELQETFRIPKGEENYAQNPVLA